MPTYYNAYAIGEAIRRDINEYSTAYMQDTDTSGAFTNEQIIDKINQAIRFLHTFLLQRIPEQFLEYSDLTGVNSVYTLPADFGVLKVFKDENGRQVFPITVDKLKLNASTGVDSLYYRKGNTLVLDKAGVAKTYRLWYYRKARDIHFGKASTGAATSITLEADRSKKIADYYNGMTIENLTKAWVDTIDDYTASYVATISETAAANDYYGIVSDLPDAFHHLIAPKATLVLRSTSPLVMKQPTPDENQQFISDLQQAMAAYAGSQADIDVDDIFQDFESTGAMRSIISNQ